jgi:Zn-dependent M28 family amino/carboxypeptidase
VPPVFNGERAFEYLEQQVSFGPRVPGSEASSLCRSYFVNFFEKNNLVIDSQKFIYPDPYSGKNIEMVNIIGRIYPEVDPEDHILLMAHYDSRPMSDNSTDTLVRNNPIDGANDGASGAAVLMELSNLFYDTKPPCGIDLVLVDGEDWGKAGDLENYLLGSREFARKGIREKYRFGIVIDMVGEKDQQLYREGYSEKFHKPLNDLVWKTAAELGIDAFKDSVKYIVIDDHLPLQSAGVSAIDIIDLDYPQWHTENDTPDKCSPLSLANVGRVLAKIIYNPSQWPKK